MGNMTDAKVEGGVSCRQGGCAMIGNWNDATIAYSKERSRVG